MADEETEALLGAQGPPRAAASWRRRLARWCAVLALAVAGLGQWYRTTRPCYHRRFAYATMLTKRVGSGEVSPCYKAALALLLRSWLATHSRYPLILMTTADLDEGLTAIVNERPGSILPFRVEQLQQDFARMGDLGAMATKLNLWELGPASGSAAGGNGSGGARAGAAQGGTGAPLGGFDQIAYYDSDHVFLSNTDSIFDACTCSQRFCGAWDSRMPPREFPNVFGEPARGSHFRKLINAGMLVVRPDAAQGAFLRGWWARRAEVLLGPDAPYVLTGSDQTWFNFMMGKQFNRVNESFNLGHPSRGALLNANKTDFRRFLTLDGTARDPGVPTVVHTKPWLRGKRAPEDALHRALLARYANPYVHGLLGDKRCSATRKREVQRIRPEDLQRFGIGERRALSAESARS